MREEEREAERGPNSESVFFFFLTKQAGVDLGIFIGWVGGGYPVLAACRKGGPLPCVSI